MLNSLWVFNICGFSVFSKVLKMYYDFDVGFL